MTSQEIPNQKSFASGSSFAKPRRVANVGRILKTSAILGLLAAAAFAWGSGPVADNEALWRPRLATPAIVALDSSADRQFTAEVKASPSAKDWRATIANDLKSWPCEIISATYSKINRGTEPGWQIKIGVPTNASPELFALTVSSSESTSVQNQSVSIVPAFETNFYVLHITDEQIVNKIHTDPSGQYHKMVGTWDEMKWMQEPVNLINPRCVIITGDQIDFNGALDGWNNWANWGYSPHGKRLFTAEETTNLEYRLSDMYKDCHEGYHVAYAETPGNHDVPPRGKVLHGTRIDWHPVSIGIYEKLFGQRSWSFRMGDFYVLMHDWSDEGLREWAAQDYAVALADPTIKYRLVGQHFWKSWNGGPSGTSPFVPDTCDLMLIGHGHVTKTVQTSPYYIYENRAAFVYGTAGFFNFRHTTNGWTCDQTASLRDEQKDVFPLFTANGITKKVRTDQPDPMNVTTNQVTVTNDLAENFYDGRVRFVLGKGTYHVENGTVLSEYDCANNTKTAVLVRVNIPANGSITVNALRDKAGAGE
jgi:hypothetical protein